MDSTYNKIMRKALLTFSLMLGLLFAVATGILWYFDMPLSYGITAALITVVIQYIFGPIIVCMLYDIEFAMAPAHISPEIYAFVRDTCKEIKIPVPELGVIMDGNPNAFTFGYSRRFAKLVLTEGLMEVLSEDELKAVILHELGHIKHNDFIIMTLISIIPIVLYQIYAWTRNRDKSDAAYWVGMGAYGAYIFSQYIALSFSRMREYYADSFSRKLSGTGEYLKNALIKIAYGCTTIEGRKNVKSSAIGIANALQSESYALAKLNSDKYETAKDKLMNWDINSVWGKWYELNSTHPLTAKRVVALTGEKYEVSKANVNDIAKFLLEAVISILPWLSTFAVYFANKASILADGESHRFIDVMFHSSYGLMLIGITILIKFYYSYRNNFESCSSIDLLERTDASPVKGIPAILKGRIIGKGIPGLFYSEDFVLDDGTGLMLIDYKQPMRILEFLFGVFKAEELQNKDVEIVGWYKRANRPYFVCNYIISEGKKVRSYNYWFEMLLGYGLIIGGTILYLMK